MQFFLTAQTSALFFASKDCGDLLQVVEVVPGHHGRKAFDGFLAALGMNAVMLPLLRREALVERQIRVPQYAELLQGLARVAFSVLPCGQPGLLIVGLDGVPGAPRIERSLQLATISASARCARISAADHFSGAGRFRNFAGVAPLISRSSFFAVAPCTFTGSWPVIFDWIRCTYC